MKEYVSNNVATLRKELDITQEAFAKAIGISRQTVVAIEKGTYTPSLLLGLKIAKFFNRTIEEIFTYVYER